MAAPTKGLGAPTWAVPVAPPSALGRSSRLSTLGAVERLSGSGVHQECESQSVSTRGMFDLGLQTRRDMTRYDPGVPVWPRAGPFAARAPRGGLAARYVYHTFSVPVGYGQGQGAGAGGQK